MLLPELLKAPTQKELTAKLGAAKPLWDELVAALQRACGTDGAEWGSSSKKTGWSLRVKRKERIIVYLAPSEGCFLASFALGDRAMHAARAIKFGPSVIEVLKDAKRYAEGSAVRLEVRTEQDVADVVALGECNCEN